MCVVRIFFSNGWTSQWAHQLLIMATSMHLPLPPTPPTSLPPTPPVPQDVVLHLPLHAKASFESPVDRDHGVTKGLGGRGRRSLDEGGGGCDSPGNAKHS